MTAVARDAGTEPARSRSASMDSPCCGTCGALVTGSALELGRRFGVYRCSGTYCPETDGGLMRAIRALGGRSVGARVAAPPSERERELERVLADLVRSSTARVRQLERALRALGVEVPP